ncbi:MAG: polysaccharide deacetylase family protein [Clostridia bacterium]|nr:polysaccharide deacetylase family protein [Clostridia bacterium]
MVIRLHYKIAAAVLLAALLLCAALAFGSRHTQAIAPVDERIRLPIIMYHEIRAYNNNRMAISPYEFESDLRYLQRNGYTTITMTDLIHYVYDDMPLPEKPIILTFDDGYLNNYAYAFPLLKKYHMTAVLSVIGKNADDFTRVPDKNLDYSHATWDQLAEMARSGCFEIQNHTYNMHTITYKRYGCAKNAGESEEHYEKALTDDLMRCQQEISDNLGTVPNTFTYPYGNVSSDSLAIIKKLGFLASLSCKYGINLIDRNPDGLYCLMRISRYHDVSLSKTLSDAMKTLKYAK